MKKPFTGKDGVPRLKVKLRFNLLPNHLQIRAKRYYGLVNGYANRYSHRPELVLSVIHTESYFNPLAVSPANAHGLMQLIPKYGGRDAYRFVYGEDRLVTAAYLYTPRNNIELGTAYLAILRDKCFREVGDPVKRRYLIICAYNWGPGSISRSILSNYDLERMNQGAVFHLLQKKTPEETANYLAKVTERMKLYAKLYR